MKALDPVGDASYNIISKNRSKDTPCKIFFLPINQCRPLDDARLQAGLETALCYSVALDEAGQGKA